MYKPLVGNEFPSYFLAMLDDTDRMLKYSSAIRECISSLNKKGIRPIVLDVGVGTGVSDVRTTVPAQRGSFQKQDVPPV